MVMLATDPEPPEFKPVLGDTGEVTTALAMMPVCYVMLLGGTLFCVSTVFVPCANWFMQFRKSVVPADADRLTLPFAVFNFTGVACPLLM
jgi:hypothetical protein